MGILEYGEIFFEIELELVMVGYLIVGLVVEIFVGDNGFNVLEC